MKIIKGTFKVQSTPIETHAILQSMNGVSMVFRKTFHGDLNATSEVIMMGVMDKAIGSGGYVALEKVIGSIENQQGSFLLQHASTIERGESAQRIQVIPDSGTGQLQQLRGTMVIDIVDNQHIYMFEYTL